MEEGCTIDGKFHNLEVENLLTAGEFKISDSIALTDITLQESIDIGTSATIGTDLTVDTNTLVVNSTNNNVGIGVDEPISTLKLDVSGNVRINGDLQVIGTTTSTTEEATSLSAPLQQLGTGTTGQPSNDSGIVIERGDQPNVFMGWDESEDKFIMGIAPNASNENITADSSGDLTLEKQDLQVLGIIADNLTGTITTDSASQPNITGVGTITSGTWQGTPINDTYISSSSTWNDKQDALTFGISDGNVIKCGTGIANDDFLRVNGTTLEGINSSELKTAISLNNVENTALSTWTGSSSITTLGTIASGTWNGSAIPIAHGGTGATTASGAASALGLGTEDSPQFASINLGHASDTIITRDSAGVVSIAGNEVRTGIVPENKGGTGIVSHSVGTLLIGNSSGGLTSSTLSAGSGISIANGDGSITITADVSEFTGLTDTPNSYTSYAKNIIQVNSTSDGLEFTKSPELSIIGLRVSGTDNQFTVGVDDNDSDKFKIGTTAIDTNPRLTIDSAGNVGIGNSSPGYLLDVAGDINLTGDLKVNGANAVFSNWTASTNGTDIYRNSNVGIGVTDPTNKLDVDGDINLTGNLKINDTSVLNETTIGSSIVNSSLTSVGALDGGSITSNFGDINIGTSTITCSSISGTLTTPSQTNITSVGTLNTLDVTDDITISGTSSNVGLTINNTNSDTSNDPSITLQSNDFTRYVMGIDRSDSDKFKIGTTSVDTNTRLSIDADGNVGIGTNNPVSTLQLKVPASKDATDASNFDHYGMIISKVGTPSDGTETGICFDIQSGADPVDTRGPGAAITHERTGTWSQGKLHFKTKQSNVNDADCVTAMTVAETGNVGIGTTSPDYKLDVNGSANISSNLNIGQDVDIQGKIKGDVVIGEDSTDTIVINSESTFNSQINMGASIIPTNNSQFDIGSAEKKVRHLYLSNNSLYIGNETISYDPISESLKLSNDVAIGTQTSKLHVNGDSRIDGTISYGSTNKTASLYIKGTGLNNAANRLVILSGETIVNTSTTGLTLTIINGQTLQHESSTNYNTYSDANKPTDSNNLGTAINNMTHTQIGILTSADSFTRNITSDLRTAAMRVGLTKLAQAPSRDQTNNTTREPYAAIFYGTSSDSDSSPQYIRDVIEIYRNNEDSDGTNLDESPPAIISTTLSSDGNYAGIAGASSVNALWAASPVIENPALICDKAGNVGIGTTNPQSKLHMHQADLRLDGGESDRRNPRIVFEENTGDENIEMIYDGSSTGSANFFAIRSNNSSWDNIGINYQPSTGYVGIGTNNPTTPLYVNGANLISLGQNTIYSYNTIIDYNSVNTNASIYASNGVIADFFRARSDERIKKNFKHLNDYEYLQKIKKLKPYTYQYIDIFNKTDVTVTGFKAQEVKNIIPGSVGIMKDYIPNIYKKVPILSKIQNTIITIENILEYNLSIGNILKIYEYFPDTTLETTKQSLNIKSINGVNITLDGYLTTSNTKIWIRGIGDCNVNTQGDINTDAIIIIPTNISSNLTIGDVFEIYECQPNEKDIIHNLEILNIDEENVTLNGTITTSLNEIFVYGKEVDDLHNLSNDRITPVCVAGIQEIDRRVVSHFTGSHTCYPENESLDYNNYIGLIVISTGSFKIKYNDNIFTGKQAIKIDHSTPQIRLSNVDNQKSVLGVVSLVQDDTVLINSSGEGGIWVCNKNGNLENGDYISSSSIPGYGILQYSNKLLNSTVGKIRCNIDFNSVNDYDTRFLLPDGTQITEEEYSTKKSLGEIVYIACFVGCTYNC